MTVMTDREHNEYMEEHERVLEFEGLREMLQKHTDDYIVIAAWLMDNVWTPEQGVYTYNTDEELIYMGEFEISLEHDRWVFENIIRSAPTHYYFDLLDGLKTEFRIAGQMR